MARFCEYCGRQMAEEEICNCPLSTKARAKSSASKTESGNGFGANLGNFANNMGNFAGNMASNIGNIASNIDTEKAKGFMENMKDRMGIGDPELNKTDSYENGLNIVPDCVKASEGEIPVKQYELAMLRSRIFGISHSKAVGRIQVTNKRVIFRAPGRNIVGRTVIHNEFAVDDIAGIESRRTGVFNMGDLICGLIVSSIGGLIGSALAALAYNVSVLAIILALVLGIGLSIPFFVLKKKWLLKILCQGISFYSLMMVSMVGAGGFLVIFGIISGIILIIALVLNSIKPNLVVSVKTKYASEAIGVRRRGVSVGATLVGNTGYAEVIPSDDAEKAIREIGAIIKDMQEHGDAAVAKWRT